MSKEHEQEFFADGLTEDIITKLSYLRGLLVISRTSTFAYKGRAVRINDVARDLGVRYILEGSVRKFETRVRVTAQLIDASSGGHLWSQKYDRELTDVFAIQDDITQAIVISMQVKLTNGEAARLQNAGTRSLDAWDSFLQGTQVFLDYTKESMQSARNLFEAALGYDPNYLDAKVYLSWTHWIDARYGYVADRDAALSTSRRLLEEIKAANVETPDSKYLEAGQYLLERRYDEARQAAIAAFRLGPCMLFGCTPAALVQMYCGDIQSSLDITRTTLRLSPFWPNDALYYYAYALSWAGDHENAVQVAKEYSLRVPTDPYAYVIQSITCAFAGKEEESRLAIDRLRELYPTFTLSDFILHELYRDPADLGRVVAAVRKAGLPE
jgi:TolB-like protein